MGGVNAYVGSATLPAVNGSVAAVPLGAAGDLAAGAVSNVSFDGTISTLTELYNAAKGAGNKRYQIIADLGNANFDGVNAANPSSLVTFVGDSQARVVSSVTFRSCSNLRFENCTIRNGVAATGGHHCEIGACRIGGVDDSNRIQIVGLYVGVDSHHITLEDSEICYLDNSADDNQGYAIRFVVTDAGGSAGNVIRRNKLHHCYNDAIQYGSNGPLGVDFNTNEIYEIRHHTTGGNTSHADGTQWVGINANGIVHSDCYYHNNSQMVAADFGGVTNMVMRNCLLVNFNGPFTYGKTGENMGGWTWDSCTLHNFWTDASGQVFHPDAATCTHSGSVIKNCIIDNLNWTPGGGNAGQANCIPGGGALSGDITTTPTYDSNWEATNVSQGYRKPAGAWW